MIFVKGSFNKGQREWLKSVQLFHKYKWS